MSDRVEWRLAGRLTRTAALALCAAATSAIALGQAPAGATADAPKPARRAVSSYSMVTCYPGNLTPEQKAAVIRENGALPPTLMAPDGQRYFYDISSWHGEAVLGPAGQAQRAHLTYSFPADNVGWGLAGISARIPNVLNATLITTFGAANLDKGHELMRQSLASWRKYSGLTYTESPDDNTVEDQGTTRQPYRGDIRFGGNDLGPASSVLAYDAFPDPAGLALVGGSDMLINVGFFKPSYFQNSADNYVFLRNVVAHEHGHGLGFIHPVPCTSTKLMEPFISTNFEMVQVDERRAAGRNYGDRYSGNQSPATAKDFGSLTSPTIKSIIQRDLSTNGAGAPLNTGEDWFKFTLGSSQSVSVSVTPTGDIYDNGQQYSGCDGITQSVDASAAGVLNIELRDATGTTVIASATGAPGVTTTLPAAARAAGTYTVRVWDAGPNPSTNQVVQLYDMTVRVGTSKAPPLAIAGLNKRIAVNTLCYFMGDINSEATEDGAAITTYAWDLDGNGTFEIANSAQPTKTYTTPGTVNVTLKVTDTNGMTATDTITVEVYNPQATFTVPGPANVWLASQPAGITTASGDASPAQSPRQLIDQPVFNSDELHFTVSGTVNLGSGGSIGPDGDASNIVCSPASQGENSIAHLCAPRGALIGVFVSGVTPTPGAAGPAGLDFSTAASRDYAYILPLLNQPFFIGDGHTSANASQKILVPGGATRLFLGAMDSGLWSDNSGGFSVSVQELTGSPLPFAVLSPAPAATVASLTPLLQWEPSVGAATYSVKVSLNPSLTPVAVSVTGISQPMLQLTAGTVNVGSTYYWSVTAVNASGKTTAATPTTSSFTVTAPPPPCPGDVNGDRAVNSVDLGLLLTDFGESVTPPGHGADFNTDGQINTIDLGILLGAFGQPCP